MHKYKHRKKFALKREVVRTLTDMRVVAGGGLCSTNFDVIGMTTCASCGPFTDNCDSD